MYLKRFLVLSLLSSFVFLIALFASNQDVDKKKFHTAQEHFAFSKKMAGPIGAGDYFLTAAHCKSCHGYDSLHYANIDSSGIDVNLYDDWQSTIMANSAKDPFWRAKVSHEILVNPGHTLELQDNCTSCHAPIGNYTSKYKGLAAHYTLGTMYVDSLGLDGVSCVSCHAVADSLSLGAVFSGRIPYDTNRTIYGPFTFPMAGPMQIATGYAPKYSAHLNASKACSPCHTLINKSVDLAGNYTGGTFVEQATYQEWLNSGYSQNGITCQKCHMPKANGGVVIVNNNQSVPYRAPYNQHIFVGGNSLMVNLLKQNKNKLGIPIADRYFDSTFTATNELLQKNTLDLVLTTDSIASDTAYFTVSLTNKAGHKFPSGYPSRRAVLQLIVKDAQQDTLFKSGIFHSDFRVSGENISYEPHRDVIRQNNQTQIYELVMGDVNQQVTTVAERAAFLLKDNRLPPLGFTSSHLSYDTTKISNDALADADFNKVNAVEGSGSDKVHFHIPRAGISGFVSISAKLYYQTLPPKWLSEMLGYSSAELDSFKMMFNAANKIPVLIDSASLLNVSLSLNKQQASTNEVLIYPSITSGRINVEVNFPNSIQSIEVFNNEGQGILQPQFQNLTQTRYVDVSASAGIYYLKIKTALGIVYKKVYKS